MPTLIFESLNAQKRGGPISGWSLQKSGHLLSMMYFYQLFIKFQNNVGELVLMSNNVRGQFLIYLKFI